MGVLKAKVGGSWVPISQGWSPLAGGLIGHTRTVAAVSGIAASAVDLGASVTWTADPSRTYKTTIQTGRIDQATAGGYFSVDMTDGANAIKSSVSTSVVANQYDNVVAVLVETGLSGSVTRKARGRTSAGSAVVQAGTFVLVEDVTTVSPAGTQPPYALWETAVYTPALNSLAIGTGGSAALSARYVWNGGPNSGDFGTLFLTGSLTLGTSGASVGTSPGIGVPPGFVHQHPWNLVPVGDCLIDDSGVGSYTGVMRVFNATYLEFRLLKVDTTYASQATVTATVPVALGAGDTFTWNANLIAKRA